MKESSGNASETTSRRGVKPGSGNLLILENLFPTFYAVLWNLRAGEHKGLPHSATGSVIAFASANHGEGTSTMALNFSMAFALNSLDKVVLVDGNLRSPALHEEFGVARENGFMELLKGERKLDEVLIRVASSRLCFIPAGAALDNPVPLYESPAFPAVIQELKREFDVIIFDVAPIVRYPDMIVLTSKVDGLILVLQAESTKWEVARYAKSYLERAKVPILGAVLNRKELFIPNLIYRLL
jgi:protein-tyrosine kinase